MAKAAARALDFTNVKDGGGINPLHKEPGDYKAKIVKVDESESKAGNDMWVFVIQIGAAATYAYHCVLDEKNLWKIRNLFIAAGINVPKKRVKVDPTKVLGREIGVTLEDDEYDGKVKSTIVAVFPADEVDGAAADDEPIEDDDEMEEEEETPAPRRKAKKPAPVEDDEDDVDDELDLEDL